MRKKPILLIMAAGIGSRFGGLKQMTPFGPCGESIIDYTLYDALLAGFERVVFVVNRRIYDDFREIVGNHAEKHMEVRYVYQELNSLPEGCQIPEGREKPWGTGHAVMCAADMVDAPFCAVNGDDFYGRSALSQMYGFLSGQLSPYTYGMVGFELQNTLSEFGYVSRGVCDVDANGFLNSVVERTHIIGSVDGPLFTNDGKLYTRLPENTVVSMNFWGFTPDFMGELSARFPAFHRIAMAENPLKAEYYLPFVVSETLKDGLSTVRVMNSKDKWYGVTNQKDAPFVKAAIRAMTEEGLYPQGLWKA